MRIVDPNDTTPGALSRFYPSVQQTAARNAATKAAEAKLDAPLIAIDAASAAQREQPIALSPQLKLEQDARLAEYEELKRTNPFRASRHVDRFGSSIFAAKQRRDSNRK